MKVADVMTSPAFTCRAHEPLELAARIMWEHDTGAVAVVDAQGRILAMITDRDLCMAAYTQGKRLSEIRIQEAMSRVAHSCHPEDKLSAAERTMRVHQVRRLPVVDDAGRVLGVLSLSDVCRERTRSPLGRAVESLTADLVVTLTEITRPRAERASPDGPAQRAATEPIASYDLPMYRDGMSVMPPPRVPPAALRDPSSLFRF